MVRIIKNVKYGSFRLIVSCVDLYFLANYIHNLLKLGSNERETKGERKEYRRIVAIFVYLGI